MLKILNIYKDLILILKEKENSNRKTNSFNGYRINKKETLIYLGICFFSAIVISILFYNSILISLPVFIFMILGIKLYEQYMLIKRKSMLKEQFRDLLYSISASVSTGRQITEALFEAEDNLKMIYSDKAIIVEEVSLMTKRLSQLRESEDEILRKFAEKACDEDIKNFVDIYLTCRITGGDIIKVITKSASIIMDKISIEKEIRTITAQKRYEAKILTSIPFVILGALRLTSDDYLYNLYNSIEGRLIMSIAIAGIIISYYLSMKITNISV